FRKAEALVNLLFEPIQASNRLARCLNRSGMGRLTSLLRPGLLLPGLLPKHTLDVCQVLFDLLGDLGLPGMILEPAIHQDLVAPLIEPAGIFLEQLPEVAADGFPLGLGVVLSRGRFLLCHENSLLDLSDPGTTL